MINDVAVTSDFISCEFSKTIAPEIGTFTVRLDNNNGEYSGFYKGSEPFEIKYDFGTTASTTIFKGFVEELKEVFDEGTGSVLQITGSHVSAVLADKTVIKSYGGVTADLAVKDLFSSYYSSFTTNNVSGSSSVPNVSWNNVPFWQAVAEIAKFAGFVCFVDDDLDVHFIPEGSKTNQNEAIVFEDTFITMEGLGNDTVEIRNKVRVHGEVDGLPLLYTASDVGSQDAVKTSFSDGVKERIIDEGNLSNESDAKTIADRELASRKETKDSGKVTSWMLPTLLAGENVWITNPTQKILGEYLVAKITHFLPEEQSICEIQDVKSIANLFRDRDLKSLSLEKITNPNDLNFSYNFNFNDDSLTDVTATESNVTVSESQLLLSSGTLGVWISKPKNLGSDVSKVHVQAIGENLQNAEFSVQADGITWQKVTLDTLETVNSSGRVLRLKVYLKASTVRVSSAVILYT